LHGSFPKTNKQFWANKLSRNKMRDSKVRRVLNSGGWSVLRIWQHELGHRDRVARRVCRALDQKVPRGTCNGRPKKS
jgi:G:T-mismatch repair DNA endonuclease (very short patch repair protein)